MSVSKYVRRQYNAVQSTTDRETKTSYNIKIAPYGTDGRLLLTANFKVT